METLIFIWVDQKILKKNPKATYLFRNKHIF